MNKEDLEFYFKIIARNVDSLESDLSYCELTRDNFSFKLVHNSLESLKNSMIYLYEKLMINEAKITK